MTLEELRKNCFDRWKDTFTKRTCLGNDDRTTKTDVAKMAYIAGYKTGSYEGWQAAQAAQQAKIADLEKAIKCQRAALELRLDVLKNNEIKIAELEERVVFLQSTEDAEKAEMEKKHARALGGYYCPYNGHGIEMSDEPAGCIVCEHCNENTKEKQRQCLDKFFINDTYWNADNTLKTDTEKALKERKK